RDFHVTGVQTCALPISIAADVRRFTPGDDVVAGIGSIPAYGHTPGHTAFGFEDGGHRFAYLGDLTNVVEPFLRHPDWAVRFDMEDRKSVAQGEGPVDER